MSRGRSDSGELRKILESSDESERRRARAYEFEDETFATPCRLNSVSPIRRGRGRTWTLSPRMRVDSPRRLHHDRDGGSVIRAYSQEERRMTGRNIGDDVKDRWRDGSPTRLRDHDQYFRDKHESGQYRSKFRALSSPPAATGRGCIKLPQFDGTEPLSIFLLKFDNYC